MAALAAAVLLGLVLLSGCERERRVQDPSAPRFVAVGTGGVTGVYYPVGGAICRRVNKDRNRHGLRCTVESTAGSVYNTLHVLSGDLDFGIAQSDVQWRAWSGQAPFEGKQANLRTLFSLHPETAILVVRADAGIRVPEEMRGKRINLGNPGSGQRGISEAILTAIGLTPGDLALAGELRSSEQGEALRLNEIDGFLYVVGHPNGGLKDIFVATDARLLPLAGTAIDRLVADNPFFVHAATPGGLYRGVKVDVPSFAVTATVVTSAQAPDALVYEVVRAVFDDLDAFTALHPALAGLTPRTMLQGLTAPYHAGALKYYSERGLP